MSGAGASPVPLDGRPWRLTMGLRPLDEARWLDVDARREAELAAKRRLYASQRNAIHAELPGSEAATVEVLHAVTAWLGAHRPQLPAPRPDTGDPLAAAALAVQEDLCVMERRPTGWALTAASVCFPSRWALADKVGRDLDGIHGPVPGYGAALGTPVRAFFDRITVERPVWRLNWTLIDTPELHLPADAARADHRGGDPASVAAGLWFRVERQTLRRLERTGGVVFTIRTYVTPLAELVAAHPDAAAALRATLPTAPAATRAYKGWEGIVGPLVEWLGTFGEPRAS